MEIYLCRSRHEHRRRHLQTANKDEVRRPSEGAVDDEEDEYNNLDAWKPSVYWVMFYLSIASMVVAFSAASMFFKVI